MKKHKILMVDDEISWLLNHSDSIEKFFPGLFDIGVASSASEALEIIPSFRPDLVLTDLQMEDIEGEAYAGEFLVKNLRKNYPDIKIVIISSAQELEDIARTYSVDACIFKPALLKNSLGLKIIISEIFDIQTEIC